MAKRKAVLEIYYDDEVTAGAPLDFIAEAYKLQGLVGVEQIRTYTVEVRDSDSAQHHPVS